MNFNQWLEEQSPTVKKYALEFEDYWLSVQKHHIEAMLSSKYEPAPRPLNGFRKEFDSCRIAAMNWINEGFIS
jgi:hypothetical protein